MRTCLISFIAAALAFALLATFTEATQKPNSFRQRARKRQFADNSQLINVEQNGIIFNNYKYQ